MSAQASPKYVYKIVPSTPPDPIPSEYPLSELDRHDGFVHLSTAAQVPKTADLFFHKQSTLWIIRLSFAEIASSVKWEELFPHLYGNFGKDNVDSVQRFERVKDEPWSERLKHSAWLE